MRMETSFINMIICIWLLSSDKNDKTAFFFLSQCVLVDISTYPPKIIILCLLKLEVRVLGCFFFLILLENSEDSIT